MSGIGSLIATIGLDSAKFRKGLAKAQASIAEFDKSIQAQSRKLKKFGGQMSKVGKSLTASVTLPIVGMGALAVKAFGEQAKAEAKLSSAIKQNGKDVSETLSRYKKFATQLQSVTTVGDEATLGLISMAEVMQSSAPDIAARNAIGLSKALGVAEQSALKMVVASEAGDFTLLNRYVPALRAASSESEKAAIVSKLFADGLVVAKAEAESGVGPLIQLKNTVGDLMEEFGGIIAGAIKPLVEWIKSLVDKFKALTPVQKKMVVLISALAAAVGPLLMAFGFLSSTVLPALMAGFAAISAPVAAVIAVIAGAAILIISNWDEIKAYFTSGGGSAFWGEMKDLITEVFDAISGVITASVDAIKKVWKNLSEESDSTWGFIWDVIKNILNIIWKVIKTTWENVAAFFRIFTNILTGDWAAAWNEIKGVLFRAFDLIVTILSSQIDNILAIIGKVVGLFDKDWADAVNSARTAVSEFSADLVEGANEFIGYEKQIGDASDELAIFSEKAEEATKSVKKLNKAASGAGREKQVTTGVTPSAAPTSVSSTTATVANDPFQAAAPIDIPAPKTDSWLASYDTMSEKASAVIGEVGAAWGGLTEIMGGMFDNQDARIDQALAKEVNRIKNTALTEEEKNKRILKAEAKADKKRKALKRKQAKADKAMAIVSAIISTAAGIAAQYQAGPAGIALAAIVAIMGAAQIAVIASQPIPAFATGGAVMGETMALVGEQSSRSNPEVIMPFDKLSRMMGGSSSSVEVTGRVRVQGEDLIIAFANAKRNADLV